MFLKFRERPSFWGSARRRQDDGRMFCQNHTERLNRGFSTVKRKACGYRAIVNRITTLHRVAGKLRLPYGSFHSNRWGTGESGRGASGGGTPGKLGGNELAERRSGWSRWAEEGSLGLQVFSADPSGQQRLAHGRDDRDPRTGLCE